VPNRIANSLSEERQCINKIIGTKAISFDADGTLWHFEKVMRHSLFHVLVELKKLDPEAVDVLNVDKPSETSVDPMALWHCTLIRYT